MSKYIAFISYRHGPADSRAAADVQKRIETYPIPRALRDETGSRHPGRVFLDKSELSTTYDLTDDIKEALRESRYLIVVCSRHALGSSWIPREIALFLETHTRKEILTVLVDGEPSEVIPEIILRDPEGPGDVRVHDPLSCDYRLPRRKVIREEIPRLVSVLIGCGYADLIDRAARRRRRILAGTLSAAALVALTAISYLLWSNHEISRHYRESQRRYLVNMTAVCSSLADEGRRQEALSLALAAMESAPDQEMPSGLYRLLSEETGVYATAYTGAYDGYVNTGCFQTEGAVTYMAPDPEGTRLAVCDDGGRFYLWDLDSRDLLLMRHLDSNPGQPVFRDGRVFFLCGSTAWCFLASDGSLCWQQDCQGLETCFLMGKEGPLVMTDRRVFGLDMETGDVLFMKRLDQVPGMEAAYGGSYAYHMLMGSSEDMSRALVALYGEEDVLFLLDGEGNVSVLPDLREEDISSAGSRNLYLSGDARFYTILENPSDTAGTSLVRAFSPEGKILWEYTLDYLSARFYSRHNWDYSLDGRSTELTLTGDTLNVYESGLLMNLSADRGEPLEQIQFTDRILLAISEPGNDSLVMTRDGSVAYRNRAGGLVRKKIGPEGAFRASYVPGTRTADGEDRFFYQFEKSVLLVRKEDRDGLAQEFEDSGISSYGYLQSLEADGCLYVLSRQYDADKGETDGAALVCLDPETMDCRFKVSIPVSYGWDLLGCDEKKGRIFVADASEDTVWIADGKTGDCVRIRIFEEEEYRSGSFFLLDGRILALEKGRVTLVDPDSGEREERELDQTLLDAGLASLQEDGTLLSVTEDGRLCRTDPLTGEQTLMGEAFAPEEDTSGLFHLLTCESGDAIAWSFGNQKTVRLFHKKSGLETNIERAAQSPAAIGFEDEEVLILYQDGILNRHRLSDGCYLGSLDLERTVSEGASFRRDREGRIRIEASSGIWLLDPTEWSVRAWIDGAAAYDEDRNSCYVTLYDHEDSNRVRFGLVPVRSPEELLEIAGQLTGGGVLTREQMDLYGLQE